MDEKEYQDFIHEDEELISKPISLKTGVTGNVEAEKPQPVGLNPNAPRVLFNPFMVIDLMNEGASCGMLFLKNIAFSIVRSINTNNGKDFTETGQSPGAMQHNPANYTNIARTAYMISEELTRKNGEKGVIEISELTGREDEAADLNAFFFGDEVECVMDMNYPDHPCPVLPNLLEKLQANVQGANAEALKIARKVRDSISQAMRYARSRIDDAQKRMLEAGNPNKTLSPDEQRCYLALGEAIPNQMPYLTKSAVASVGQGMDAETVVSAVVAGVQTAMRPTVQAQTVKVSNKPGRKALSKEADFTVEAKDIKD